MPVTTRFFSWLLVLMLLLAAPFALAAPTTPTEDFTDNLDGTVTHRITGLTWMRCAMGMTWDGTTCTGTASTHTWDQATKLTANFAGKSDWRLPSIAELNTIVERNAFSPAVNSTVFPNSPNSPDSFDSMLWSGSLETYESSERLVWVLNCCQGYISMSRVSYNGAVRLVRGGPPFNPLAAYTPTVDFYDNSDGTVTHLKTGLVWQRCAIGQIWSGGACTGSISVYDWTAATALTSNTAGHIDWRLPTLNELLSIVEYRATSPAINTDIFPLAISFDESYFWSSSSDAADSSSAWMTTFYGGWIEPRSKADKGAVRLVGSGLFFGVRGFTSQADVGPGIIVTSNTLEIGPDTSPATAISIVGGSYSINGGAFTAAPGTVHANDSVTVRMTSAVEAITKRATLTVGSFQGGFSVTTKDSQSPETPTNLTALASGDVTIKLQWLAATDNVGVTAYKVYRNGSWLTTLNTVASFTDREVSAEATYSYSIAACDAGNNCSALSAPALATAWLVAPKPLATPTEDFADNLDGTVTHRITGLTWMRCSMGMTWDGTTCTGTASTYTWAAATKLTANFAGSTDWRVPSIAELSTIAEREINSPGVNSTIFPNTLVHSFYWSGSPDAASSDLAWLLGKGSSFHNPRSGDYAVRLVRGGQPFDPLALYSPSKDFFDNSDGSVTHLKTGLMWKRCAEGQTWSGTTCSGSASTYDWGTAVSLTSSSAGHNDWRLPSANELLTIVEYQTSNPAINTAIFPGTRSSFFWSGAPGANSAGDMGVVVFNNGGYFSSAAYASAVRLVRSGQFFGPLGFAVQTGVAPGTVLTSNVLKIAPVSSVGVAIAIVGGSYSINGGAYTTAAGTVHPSDSVMVRVTSAPGFATTTRATLTIGAIGGNFSVTTRAAPDTQVPSGPGNVLATAITNSKVALSWSAGIDNVGVTAYRVYRDGSLVTTLGAVTRFTDTGLDPATSYSYRVAACDASNNCSAQSPAIIATARNAISIVPVPSTPTSDFVDNGDGTVTNRITGLTWMRCPMGMTWRGTGCIGTESTYTWDQATKLNANFAGKSDWRLPSIAELNSIVERAQFSPAISRVIFPDTQGVLYWTASLYGPNPTSAWVVHFGTGSAYAAGTESNFVGVRLVRDGKYFEPLAPSTPISDFLNNSDGTVTHLKTGLMWKRCAEGQSWNGTTCAGNASTYDWDTAVALTSSSAGHNDWRLPTASELLTIVEYVSVDPALNTTMFPRTPGSFFWSGSPDVNHSGNAWIVLFFNGYAYGDGTGNDYSVRLVRGGQIFSPFGFNAQAGVATNTTVVSNALKVFGIGGKVFITGGQYSINDGAFTSTSDTIKLNDSVTVRVTSAPTPGSTTRATLSIGNISGDFSVTTAADAQAPATPANLTANSVASPSGAATVKLTWSASSDNTGVTHYRINRNGALLAVVSNPAASYTDIQPANTNQFTYAVQACDAAYNCSTLSSTASATRTGTINIAPQLSSGAGHSAGIKNDGSLFTWGFNEAGQLGTGVSGDHRTSPQRPIISPGSVFTAVAMAASHTLAIKTDGTLWSWGGNASGQLGDGTTTSRNTPTQIGTGYMALAAGNSHSVAIKTDGTLWAWGNNGTGQLGDGTNNSTSTPIQVGSGFYTVSAGTSHTVAIKTNGTLWAWGSNNFGQLGDSTGNDRYAPQLIGSGFTAAAAGAFHTIAVKNDGTLWAWGQNTNGQLGDGTTQNRYAPVQVGSGYSPVSANGVSGTLAAGNAHNLALKPDGSLWAWGANASGQLGDGTTTDSLTPKAIEPASVCTSLAANANHSLALKPDGTVWSWGSNSTGQLGDATLASRQSSVLVLNETVDGALDLIPEVANTIPADKLPSFLIQVAKSANVTSTVKYNLTDLNQSGSVYVVAYLRPDSPLLLPSVNPTSKIAGGILTKDTGCPANTTGTVPAVLTRGGWKQTDCTTPTLPLYTGTLNTANNTFGMYDSSKFDQTKDNGLFCVAYAGASATSAKGLIRSVVSGVDANLTICPPILIGSGTGNTGDTAAPSIPMNITATAAGPGQVNLNWSAATDNTAVVRYNIYRGTSLIATLDNVTSYTDRSPLASTAYSYSVMACDAAANCSGQSTPAQTATPAQPSVTLGAGWNLVGNGGDTAMNVSSLFGDASKIYSLWKWVKTGSSPNITYPAWAFYTPGQTDSGAAYAANKGYDTFSSIASGEGFWVNAKVAMTVPMTAPAWILSSVFAPNQSKTLTSGWSLIATGEAQTASAFNKAMSTTPPAAGVIPINLTSLWTWQNSAQRWYFYAPSLDSSGGLSAYLGEKNYMDLGAASLTPTMGFWVNKP